MNDPKLRRWLVPGAALASIAAPLLAGACFGQDSEWFRDCEACAQCTDFRFGRPPVPGPIPEDLPPLPQEQLGQETGQPPEEVPPDDTAEEMTGETAGATAEEEADPPTQPYRPRIPDGVLQPRPEPHLQAPTQGPKPDY